MGTPDLTIVTGAAPDDIVRFAAGELTDYIDRLFGIKAEIRPTAGRSEAMIFLDAAQAGVKPPGEEQAFILRRLQRNGSAALAAVGGSPVATLWAVYDLVERWGVRYLLRGDVFPGNPGPFRLPEVDLVRRPNLRVRGARLINVFSMGAESWGLADMRRYMDQLAKLKFNSIHHQLWCWQPYIHYECRGVSKSTGVHWLGWHYPIDEKTIGRHHFGGATEFVPPDFEGCRTYAERVEVGQQLIRATLEHARQRGMETQIWMGMTDFTPEFMHVLDIPPVTKSGFGLILCGDHRGADHTGFQDLWATSLRAYVDTYPDTDYFVVSMPEYRLAEMPYEAAWDRLNKKYDFDGVRSLDQVLAEAATREDYLDGGASRIVRAVKGDIVALDLVDRMLDEQKILADCARSDANVVLTNVSEELTEVYARMRPGSLLPIALDYTSARAARRPQAFERIGETGLRPSLTMTTQDDNIGVLPQLSTVPIHQLLENMRQNDWEGFQLRYWMISDLEPTAAYLSAALWDKGISVESAYREHAEVVCGEAAIDAVVTCFQVLDRVTDGMGDHAFGLGFPVPETAVHHWINGQEFPEELAEDREQWRQALAHARRGREVATRGHDYLDYLIGRLEFGICFLDMVEQLRKGGRTNRGGDHQGALECLERSVDLAHQVVGIHARITRDGTDLGTLAQLNEDLCNKLDRLLTDVQAGKQWAIQSGGRGKP